MDKKELIDLVKEINVLRLTSKDVLVVKLPDSLAVDQSNQVCKIFSEVFETLNLPADNLVLTTLDTDMVVLRKEEE